MSKKNTPANLISCRASSIFHNPVFCELNTVLNFTRLHLHSCPGRLLLSLSSSDTLNKLFNVIRKGLPALDIAYSHAASAMCGLVLVLGAMHCASGRSAQTAASSLSMQLRTLGP